MTYMFTLTSQKQQQLLYSDDISLQS